MVQLDNIHNYLIGWIAQTVQSSFNGSTWEDIWAKKREESILVGRGSSNGQTSSIYSTALPA